MSLVDELRDKVNEFLNNGKTETKVDAIFEEEMDNAIHEVRGEIAELCKASVRTLMDDLKTIDITYDKKRMSDALTRQLEYSMEMYEDEIQHEISKVLIEEIKSCKIMTSGEKNAM